jgi:hypothetical protein
MNIRFDTLQGIRGEINITVKVQFFGGDMNPMKDSSAGVQFFSMTKIPFLYKIDACLGFVSALDNVDGHSLIFSCLY